MAKTTLNLRIEKGLKDRLTTKLKATGETATDVVTRSLEAYCNDSSVTVTPSPSSSNATVTQSSNASVTIEEIDSLKKQ